MSAASSACDHIHDWVNGTPEGTWVSMGVYSDGSYEAPAGLIYSFPCTCKDGKWSIVKVIPLLWILNHATQWSMRFELESREGFAVVVPECLVCRSLECNRGRSVHLLRA